MENRTEKEQKQKEYDLVKEELEQWKGQKEPQPERTDAVVRNRQRLDEKGIPYDSCPGVSAFCGAASALNLEYTLPDISQSVIITRMEGRYY